MGLRIAVKRAMPPSTHAYPDFTVTLYPFVCQILSGEMTLNEHHAAVWLSPKELPTLDWVEADRTIIEMYRKSMVTSGIPG